MDGVSALAFSPDGTLVLTGGRDGIAILWNAKTGRELRHVYGGGAEVWAVVFAAGGSRFLTSSRAGPVQLWDAATGNRLQRFDGLEGPQVVGLTDDGAQVTAWDMDGQACQWNVSSGQVTRRFTWHPDGMRDVAWCFALSGDRRRAITGSIDGIARQWDTQTGKQLHPLPGHTGFVQATAISPDGRHVLTGCFDNQARLWDANTGKQVHALDLHTQEVQSAVFAPDGKTVLTGSRDGDVRLWDVASGKPLGRFPGQPLGVDRLAFSADGSQFLVASAHDPVVRLWDRASGKLVHRLEGCSSEVTSLSFSPDGKFLLVGSTDGVARVWNLTGVQRGARLVGHSLPITCLAYSPDGKYALTGSGQSLARGDNTLRLWDMQTHQELWQRDDHRSVLSAVAFSADGRRAISGSWLDDWARIWSIPDGQMLQRLGRHLHGVNVVALLPNGRRALTSGGTNPERPDPITIRTWDADTGKEQTPFILNLARVQCLAVTRDGKRAAAGLNSGHVELLNLETGDHERAVSHVEPGEMIRRALAPDHWYSAPEAIWSVAFSPDGKRLATGSADTTARVWDLAERKELLRLDEHVRPVTAVAISPDGKLLATGSADHTTRLWDLATGKQWCQLIGLRDGQNVVVAPDGRFDIDRFDPVRGVHWIVADDPYHELALEVFLRDYYEPALAARQVSGELLPLLPDLGSLNRVQPRVQIRAIEPQPGHADQVRVTVDVADVSRSFERRGRKEVVHSGVRDVRLFRAGHLVGYQPSDNGAVALRADGTATVVFEHVQLPSSAAAGTIQFSAYAFNVDRVKSSTDYREFTVAPAAQPVPRTAYLLCMGVNAFDRPEWDLRCAVPDAEAISQALGEGLRAAGQFDQCVVLPLLSTATGTGDQRRFVQKTATKANLQAALAVLSGRKVAGEILQRLPGGERLRPARPGDLVLLSFSTHGFRSSDAQFYLLPADIGAGKVRGIDAGLLRRAISSSELAAWLRDCDAGEIAMILDTCHSTASVRQPGFKPGPMGDRGFGQLAYDKKMRILAASQAEEVAMEDPRIGHGLLTYALTEEGLRKRRADLAPRDQRITLGELLQFAAARVPAMLDEIAEGKLRAVRGTTLIGRAEAASAVQQPELFDFAAEPDDVVLTPPATAEPPRAGQ